MDLQTTLLARIEQRVVEHGGDLGGWTKLDDGRLQLFDGRIAVQANVRDESADTLHAHLQTTLHDHDEQTLDVCLVGLGADQQAALEQVAELFVTSVASVIRSLLDDRAVCNAVRLPVEMLGADPTQAELTAFVGPMIARGVDEPAVLTAMNECPNWFQDAAACLGPGTVQLLKSTIQYPTSRLTDGGSRDGWRRELEVNGHEYKHVSAVDLGVQPDKLDGYATRFALVAYPKNSTAQTERRELDRTITHFIRNAHTFDRMQDLLDDMVRQGFDRTLVHEAESIATIGFGRLIFEQYGVNYSPTAIRARENGRIEQDVRIASLPAYHRGRALLLDLSQSLPDEQAKALAYYSSESHAILSALQGGSDPADLLSLPPIIPDPETTEATLARAMQVLQQLIQQQQPKPKPWWKFW